MDWQHLEDVNLVPTVAIRFFYTYTYPSSTVSWPGHNIPFTPTCASSASDICVEQLEGRGSSGRDEVVSHVEKSGVMQR